MDSWDVIWSSFLLASVTGIFKLHRDAGTPAEQSMGRVKGARRLNLDISRLLKGLNTKLANTSENLSKSRKILRSMSRKIVTNKLLLSIIIILELAILVGLVYYKFFRKS